MKKYITLLVLICVSSSYAQLNNIINKTPAELAKIVDGQTDSDAAYWESHAYLYIQNIVDRLQADFLQANDYATLSAAISAASTDTLSVMVSSRYNITTNTTLSGQTAIIARQGARFNVSSGDTLTINIPFYAGDYQVFEGSGEVRGLKNVNAIWFSSISQAKRSLRPSGGVFTLNKNYSKSSIINFAAADSELILIDYRNGFALKSKPNNYALLTNIDSLQQAINEGFKLIELQPGIYNYSTTITSTADTIKIKGSGKNSTIIVSSANPVLKLDSGSLITNYLSISDLKIDGSLQTNIGVQLDSLARFVFDEIFIQNCSIAINGLGALVGTISNSQFSGNDVGLKFRKSPTGIYRPNHITVEKSVISNNDSLGIDFDDGSGLYIDNSDLEQNGISGNLNTGAVKIGNNLEDGIGFSTVTIDKCWFEDNKGWAFQIINGDGNEEVYMSINNTQFLSSENGHAVDIHDIRKFTFRNSHAPSPGDSVKVDAQVKRTTFIDNIIGVLDDNSADPQWFGVNTSLLGLDNKGFQNAVRISNGQSLFFEWANGTAAHEIRPNTTSGRLEIRPFSTTQLQVENGLIVNGQTDINGRAIPDTLTLPKNIFPITPSFGDVIVKQDSLLFWNADSSAWFGIKMIRR